MGELTPEVINYVKAHKLDVLLNSEILPVEKSIYEYVDPKVTAAYPPEWNDLVRLHKLVRSRKVTTVLEFGCGYSTVIFADAIEKNRQEFGDFVTSNLRRSNPFEVHSVDDMAKYIKSTKNRLPKNLKSCVKFTKSEVLMTTFAGRVCTEFFKLPNICPDFIYLDAPSQDSAKGEISGISTRHPDRLPMSCDLLKIEHFLLPGTMVLLDGRTANARFLRTNFQRNWLYQHDVLNDAHIFELVESPLGEYNKAQLEFCLGNKWLASVKTN